MKKNTKEKIIEELRKAIGTFEDSFGFNGTIEELADSILGLVTQEIVEERNKSISLLRQWLNEDRITDIKKMVTNEEILIWFNKL